MSGAPPNDGGQAFPPAHIGNKGMTLRDWFAGQALAGLSKSYGMASSAGGLDAKEIAACCGRIADAMLVQRGNDTRSAILALSPDNGLGLRGRASNILCANGVDTVGQLCEMYETDLLKLRGFGEGTLDAVKAALAAHGLTLKGVANPTFLGEAAP